MLIHESQEMISKAENLKLLANEAFRASNWDSAISLYQKTLQTLPKRFNAIATTDVPLPDEQESSPIPISSDIRDQATEASKEIASEERPASTLSPESIDLDNQCAKSRAVLNSNIAACYVKLVSLIASPIQLCTHVPVYRTT
jgi:hypothetical protein